MDPNRSAGEAPETTVAEFVHGLAASERMLVTLRDELYGGGWEEMQTDLEQRLQGRPYVFKLASRIEDDLARIQKMRAFETKHGLNLRDYL